MLTVAKDTKNVAPITTKSAELISLAQGINSAHAEAQRFASKAIDYAKQAGLLLLEAKNTLPHGEWLPWLAENVSVSVRQAQRYIAAAQGKPTTLRAIPVATKNDTVSHFPEWLPRNGSLLEAVLEIDDDGSPLEYLLVQEVSHAAGYYLVAYVSSGAIDWTKRGVRSDYVEHVISDWLPGRYLKRTTIDQFGWQEYPSDFSLYDEVIKDFNKTH